MIPPMRAMKSKGLTTNPVNNDVQVCNFKKFAFQSTVINHQSINSLVESTLINDNAKISKVYWFVT